MPASWRVPDAWAAWLVTRLLVAMSVVYARSVVARGGLLRPGMRDHLRRGILGWDAQRYLQIAEDGYEALPKVELRFFPLVPMLTRALDFVLPGGAEVALLVQANVAALALSLLVVQLVEREKGDAKLGRIASWLILLTPAAFVLTWGYTEAMWGLLCVALFLTVRTGRWWWAAAVGVLVGLTRAVAPLLALPLLVEAVRGWRGLSVRELAARAACVASPVVGVLSYLAWVQWKFGEFMYPYTIQQQERFRGDLADPVTPMWNTAKLALTGESGLATMRVAWAVVLVVLVVLTFRWWPASYGVFAALMLLTALSTERLGSFERYGFSAFPVVLAAAGVARRWPAWRSGMVAVGAVSLAGYGALAMLGAYVP